MTVRGSQRLLQTVVAVLTCCSIRHGTTLSAGTRPSTQKTPIVPSLDLEEKEFEYLEANGYFTGYVTNPDKTPPGGEHFEDDAGQAIASFQEFYRLPATGKMDAVSKATMWKPRCGYPDVAVLEKNTTEEGAGATLERRRLRRYNDGGGLYKWSRRKLTYSVLNFPSRGKLKSYEVREAIKRAFGVWADVSPLEFQELDAPSGDAADIRIAFVRGNHARDKDHPVFDGSDGELAHAFSPNSGWGDVDGDVHFDDDEIFTLEENKSGYNFFQIAAHEIGHSLGLDHSQEPRALMWPHYHYISNFRLPKDDVMGIQSLYGAKPGTNQREKQTTASHCTEVFDTVTSIGGVVYAFKGDRFWEAVNGKLVTANGGRTTDDYWYNLPAQINAVYYRQDGKTLFFKGTKYWVYKGQFAMPGYPRRVAELGLPNGLDAVLAYSSTKTFFFKKNQMWRFDENRQSVDPGYPKRTKKIFKGLPRRLLSAFRHQDDQLYFLSGKKYFRVSKWGRKADKGYPRFFSVDFMGCYSAKK